MVLVMVSWLLPDQAGQVGGHQRQVADHVVEQRVLRGQGRGHGLEVRHQESMSPEREARAVSTWLRLPMIWPTWESSAPTVVGHGGAAVDQLVDLGRVALEGPRTFSTNSLACLGLMDERTGPSEFKKASMLASVTSWLSGMVAPGGRIGPPLPGIELDLLLPDHVVPPHPRRRWLRRSVTVLSTLMDDQGVAVLDRDARDLPDRDAGDVDRVAVGQAGDVGQLGVEGVAVAEERDVADLDGQAHQQYQADQREDGELEGRLRADGGAASQRSPQQLRDEAAEAGRRWTWSGCADHPVGLVGRRGGRAVGAGRGVADGSEAPVRTGAVECPGARRTPPAREEQLKAEPGSGQRLLERLEEGQSRASAAR